VRGSGFLVRDYRLMIFALFGNARSRHTAAEIQHDFIVKRTGVRLFIFDA
jgi:hypothetical protein